MTFIVIDPALVERYLRELAALGSYGETGVWRPVYSPEWLSAQDRYAEWCREAGLQVTRDSVGNVWGILPGSGPGPSVVSGSHIDSQLPGGRFDGALGTVGALIALMALREQAGPPRRTLEAVSICEEESSRFPGANFWGSRAITGRLNPGEVTALRDYEDETIGAAMHSVHLDPALVAEARREDIDIFIELHIEQGPILEHAGLPVGVVSGITGIRHTIVEIDGRSDHAGAAPMDLRLDPVPAFAAVAQRAIETARRMGRPAVTTVGRVAVEPNYPAIVPERVTFTIDARHPDAAERGRLYDRHAQIIDSVASDYGRPIRTHVVMDQPPTPCDSDLVTMINRVAESLDIPVMSLHSGAGHDSQVMANVARVAMIFVRSVGGRSHTPAELTSIDDATLGITVLANALYQLAY